MRRECILDAKNEEAVQTCLTSSDELDARNQDGEGESLMQDRMEAVEQCILDAKSEDEVQECMLLMDEVED